MSDTTRSNNYTSEASRMLEQALEQMDGIIQGAKYELPQYFETFSIQPNPQGGEGQALGGIYDGGAEYFNS